MKVAVMSDVHGYSPALDAVLADVQTHGVDQIVVAGDLCKGGPDPAGALRLIRQHDCQAVYGNTDLDLLDDDRSGEKMVDWVRSQFSDDDIAYLQSLPFAIRIPHPATEAGDQSSELLIVHANPTDVHRHLSPNDSDEELLEIIGDERSHTIAFGHLHVAYTRQVNQYELIDVSAVGSPYDKDLRPRYVIFDSHTDDAGWSYEYHYVDYPLDRTRELMETSGMPNWKKAWKKLNRASYNREI